MLNSISTRSSIYYLTLLGCLFALLLLATPVAVLAAPPPPGAEACAKCHSDETDAWQDSPHAQASGNEQLPGATCEGCHGPYVKDHPKEGVMQLTVDSSVCKDCHASTFDQWENSTHAQAGVQCIGCHLSHSQEFRLTDEAMCVSCHRDELDDISHSAHGNADVACTDCHVSSLITHQTAGTDEAGGVPAPGHDFTEVASENCVNCHGKEVHTRPVSIERVSDTRLLSMAESVPELTTKLETTEQANKSLQIMVPVCLGLGIGIGGMLGIVFMLAIGYINQRRASNEQ